MMLHPCHRRKVLHSRSVCITCVVVAVCLCLSACGSPAFRAELRGGSLDISGDVGVTVGSGRAGAGSSAAALGLDAETYVEPIVSLDWEDWHVTLRGFDIDYSGTGTAQAAIDFGPGPGIMGSEPVATDVGLVLVTTNAVYDFISTDTFDFGMGIGLGWLDYDFKTESLTDGESLGTDDYLPFAFPTLRAVGNIDRLELGLLASAIVWDYEDEELSYYDVEALAGYRLFEDGVDGSLSIGWRFLGVDYEYSDRGSRVFVDAGFNGPFVSFAVRF